MKLPRRAATICAAVAAIVTVGAGGAHAQDDALLGLLPHSPITLACFPAGQVGQGNTFTGTQNVSCSQSSSQTNPVPPPANGGGGGGVTGAEIVRNQVTLPPGGSEFVAAYCPEGQLATGGGFRVQPGDVAYVTGSLPADQNGDNRADGWGVEATNPTDEQQFLEVYALCADDAESQ